METAVKYFLEGLVRYIFAVALALLMREVVASHQRYKQAKKAQP